jgi:hypothetical protein
MHLITARFMAGLRTNNHQESIAAYLLNPLERDELHTQQSGLQTITGSVQLPIWHSGRARLSEVTFETIILDLMNAIVNACPFRDAWLDPWQEV